MKKLLSLIFAVIIILTLPAFTASAAYSAELSVSTAEAGSEKTAEIVISIKNNPGLCALGFEISYNKDAVQVMSAEFAELFSAAAKRVNTTDGKIIFNAASADNIDGDGDVAKIKFKITANEFKGSDITVKALGEKGFVLHSEADHSLVDVSLKLLSGAIIPPSGTVTEAPETDAPATDPPCMHGNVVSDILKAATCSAKGVASVKCADCSIPLGEQEVEMTDHTAGEWQTKTAPTANTDGEEIQTCLVCGQELNSRVISKLDSTEKDPVDDPEKDIGKTVIPIVIIAAVLLVIGALVLITVKKAKLDRKKQDEEYL